MRCVPALGTSLAFNLKFKTIIAKKQIFIIFLSLYLFEVYIHFNIATYLFLCSYLPFLRD